MELCILKSLRSNPLRLLNFGYHIVLTDSKHKNVFDTTDLRNGWSRNVMGNVCQRNE